MLGMHPLHQQCLLLWSNNINGPPRATAKHVVPQIQYMYSDMEMIMLVSLNAKSGRTRSNRNRNRKLQTSKAPLKGQAQGTSLFTSATSNQRGFPKNSPWEAQVRFPVGERMRQI